jgi:hypothetical protein
MQKNAKKQSNKKTCVLIVSHVAIKFLTGLKSRVKKIQYENNKIINKYKNKKNIKYNTRERPKFTNKC